MKSINSIYRLTALAMAFLMLFTSVGFTVDMHYCQGNLKSFSLFGKAKSCYELAGYTTPCSSHQKTRAPQTKEDHSIDKKDCCNNRTFNLQSDQDKEIQTSDFVLTQQLQQFVTTYVLVFLKNKLVETNRLDFALYKSPLIPRDISVLNQSFLL